MVEIGISLVRCCSAPGINPSLQTGTQGVGENCGDAVERLFGFLAERIERVLEFGAARGVAGCAEVGRHLWFSGVILFCVATVMGWGGLCAKCQEGERRSETEG